MKIIRVLLVDDHAIVRAGLRALLETAGDIQVIGEAENGQQAVRETRRLQPDVVLLDLAMPVLNGAEAARQIADEVPTAKVLILSTYSDSQHVQQAVEVGAAGYLMKEDAASDLVQAVHTACEDGVSFSPPAFKHLVEQCAKSPVEGPRNTTGTRALSGREVQVLQLIAEGNGNKQIARLLCISCKTVEKHRQAVMDKLNLHKTASLTRYAVAAGIIESGQIPHWQPGSYLRAENKSRLNGEEESQRLERCAHNLLRAHGDGRSGEQGADSNRD